MIRKSFHTVYEHMSAGYSGRILIIALMFSINACIDKQDYGFSVNPNNLLRSVESDYQTYNLSMDSPHNSVALNVRGISGTGETVDAPVEYKFDSNFVNVTPGGLLTAVQATSSTTITARISYNGSTQTRTILVSVTDLVSSSLNRIAIEPAPGDSAKITVGGIAARITKRMQLIREGSDGSTMSGLLVSLRSEDTAVARIVQSGDLANVTPVRPGAVKLYVSTYAYGKGMRDSLTFIVGWPLGAIISSYSRFDSKTRKQILDFKGGDMTVGVGACIVWLTDISNSEDLDVQFNDPDNAFSADSAPTAIPNCKGYAAKDTVAGGEFASGNIPKWRTTSGPNGEWDFFSGSRVRVFRKAGVYSYRSSINGTSGVITVCDEKNDQECAPENYKWGVK